MKLTLLGTRGSFPHIGPKMVRYGGNTSCVEVNGSDGTVLLLDAGTGIRLAASATDPGLRRLDILLTHFHMDHLQGLGFFAPLFNPKMEVHIWGPPSTTMTLRERLARYLSPPLFPVCLRDFSCRLVLHDAPRGKVEIGGLTVHSNLVCHPGPTMGYRVEDGAAVAAYLPDHELPLGTPLSTEPCWISGHALAHGADVLMHDSQYNQEEYDARTGWGHSTVRHAVEFAQVAEVKRMVTFHHDPNHDDATLDQMRDEACRGVNGALEIVAGVEGATFDL